MKNEDFEKLLTAVSEVFDVPKLTLLRKATKGKTKPRCFMCHLVYYGLPHLRNALHEKANISKTSFHKGVESADKLIHESSDNLCLMNEIRTRVGLSRLKHSISHFLDTISDTKRLFGFDYTEEEILRRRAVIRSSNEYMKKLCSIGREPIPEGMVYSPIKVKQNFRNQYRD